MRAGNGRAACSPTGPFRYGGVIRSANDAVGVLDGTQQGAARDTAEWKR